MIVFELICTGKHRFEGWFASAEDFDAQKARGLLSCPSCGNAQVEKLLTAKHPALITTYVGRNPDSPALVEEPQLLLLELVEREFLATNLVAGAVEEALRRIPQVRQLHSVSGPFDLIALVAERSIGDLEQLLDRIGRLEGVERTTSAIVMSTKLTR